MMIETNLDIEGKLRFPVKCFICGARFRSNSSCFHPDLGWSIWFYDGKKDINDSLHIIVSQYHQMIFFQTATKILARDDKSESWNPAKPLIELPFCLEIQYNKRFIQNKLNSLLGFA